MRDMNHMTILLYKGKESHFWVKDNPYLIINATISNRDNGISMVIYYESTVTERLDTEYVCTIEEFKQILRDKYLFDVGAIVDNGDVDAEGNLISR